MRIAIFSDNFYPELGGIQDSIFSLGKELAKQGHFVDFYVPKATRRDFETAGLPYAEPDMGKNVKVYRLFSLPYPSPTKQSRMVFPTGLRWLWMKHNRPDVIHTQTFFGVGLEAIVTARALKVPLVGTNHWAITEFSHYSPVRREVFVRNSLKFVSWYYNRCDFVTAPSESVFTEMLKNGFCRSHAALSNPIETSIFKPVQNESEKIKLKKKFGLSDKTIVFAARLAVEKRIDVIIRAVAIIKKEIPNINFAVAGHGIAEAGLKKLTQELGVSENVKFVGTLQPHDLADLYRASEIFAITSTSETQSMTLMQGMACGLPAVGVRARALPEYINESRGFVVEPENPAELAEKIVYLFNNEQQRAKMGMEAARYLLNYSPESVGTQWVNLYERTLQGEYNTVKTKKLVSRVRKWTVAVSGIAVAAILGLIAGAWVYTVNNPNSAYALTTNKIIQEKKIITEKIKYQYHSFIPDKD